MARDAKISKEQVDIALLSQKLDEVKSTVNKIELKLDDDYATKEWVEAEYGQTKKIVTAMLISFALAIVTAFAGFVLRGGLK